MYLNKVFLLAVFNQKTLYDAYKKRTKNIEVDMDAYNRAKETDPEFYREASSLQYGKVLPSAYRTNFSVFYLWSFLARSTKYVASY